MTEDLILVRDVEARAALRDRPIRLRVLAPYGGTWLGCGALRVLRVRTDDEGADLTLGYESYERVPLERGDAA